MHPLVSVIIPTYNRETRILKTLESVVNQTYRPLQIIVVDDGSTDRTKEIVEEYVNVHGHGDIIEFYSTTNQGAPIARNFGFAKSNGDFTVFFDSDDLMLPSRIARQISSIIDECADCSACGYYINGENGQTYLPSINHGKIIESYVSQELRGSTQSWVYRRALVEEVGGYDQNLNCFQDVDLTFRILQLNPAIAVVPEPLSVFVDHNDAGRIMLSWKTEKSLASITRYYFKVLKYVALYSNFSTIKLTTKKYLQAVSQGYYYLHDHKSIAANLSLFETLIVDLGLVKRTYLKTYFLGLTKLELMKYFIKKNIYKGK